MRGGDSGPMAIYTRLGWVLSGPVEGSTCQSDPSVNLVFSTHVLRCASEPSQPENNDLIGELKRFWDLESLGISSSEQSVYSQFINTITFRHGRYEVLLPWKDTHPTLPDNYETSLKRLKNLLNRLKEQPNVLLEYDAVIKEQIENGIVERVSEPEQREVGRVHYLPHHAVIRRDKETTKLRIVYDASCKSNGTSLNDCLYTGPTLSQKNIVLRFRTHRVAFAGDIKKAFLNVSVAEEDRDVLRFLWVDDVTKESPEVVVLRFARVVFGVSSSPFLLNATVKHHIERYEEEDSEFVETFLRSIYVDDLSTGGDTEEEAYQMYMKSKLRLAEGGFNLRKFVTHSAELRNRIEENEARLNSAYMNSTPRASEGDLFHKESARVTESNNATQKLVVEDEQSYTETSREEIQDGDIPVQKILGVQWDFVSDQLKFDLSKVAKQASESIPTKRNIASIAAKFYDRIGFLSLVVEEFKFLFQELCESKTNWDDILEGNLLTKWNKLVSSLRDVQPLS